jgi:hypothetical protein
MNVSLWHDGSARRYRGKRHTSTIRTDHESMRRGVACCSLALVALALLTVVAPVSAGPTDTASNGSVNATAATPPALNVTVNDDPVTDGEFRVLRNETTAVLRASISARGGRSLDTVLVQVGDELVVDAEDPGSSIEINRSLPIGAGNNTIRVVAEDSADELTSTRMLLYLERVPPAMDLESPNDTIPDPFQYDDVVVDQAVTDWTGRFRDLTGFRSAVVSFRYPGSGDVYRSFRVGPDASFDEEVHLQDGRTIVRVAATDTLGNDHITRFNARVVDDAAPSIDLELDRTPIGSPWYNVTATARDNVWVSNVSVDVHYLGRTPYQEYDRHYEPVDNEFYEHSRDRLEAEFNQSVRLVQGRNLVAITASDHRGQRESLTFEVGYYPETERPPAVDFLRNVTRIEGNESAFVSAVVTDGNSDLRRVVVDVENLDRRQVTDVEAFRLDNASTFLFEDTLDIAPGVSEVEITAIDGEGNRTTDTLYLNTRAQRQSERPPPGYEEAANDSDGETDSALPQDPTLTPPRTTSVTSVTETGSANGSGTPTTGSEAGRSTGGGGETEGGSGADTGGSGPLAALTSLPVVVALVALLLGGGYWGWIKLTRV